METSPSNDEASFVRTWLTSAVDTVSGWVKQAVLYVTFVQTKQPSRILSVLKSVYVSSVNIDEELVTSIVDPAQHPDAPQVFYKVVTGNGRSMNEILGTLDALPEEFPVLLLWCVCGRMYACWSRVTHRGMQDPWIVPSRAAKIQSLYSAAELVPLQSGHCPQDDTPAAVNDALTNWVAKLQR